MNKKGVIRWPVHRKEGRQSLEPSAALFQGLRVRLTLWYCLVLGAALVLFSIALYIGAQYFLLQPIKDSAANHAHGHVEQWLHVSPAQACSPDNSHAPAGAPPPDQGPFQLEKIACFDQHGTLLRNDVTVQLPAAFLTDALAKKALQTGQPASDTVNVGGTLGQVYRYALPVPDPTGRGSLGVVLVGESMQAQDNALSLLLTLLLTVGSLSLLGAGLGGLFLANRALAPARLAFTRQQRFIADAAHELRTPLTLMRADAEVLLRGREHLAAEDAALLEDIVAEANHMSTLATSMLTLARLDAGSQHREHEVVSLDEVALRGVQRVAAFAEQKGVVVRKEQADSAYVIGDPMLLEQAMLVLLDNAIKYNRPGGQVTVRTSVLHGQARLEVCDTGIGIAAEHLPHLGERFYRVDKARSRESGGTGLGLSIAQRITAAHGGSLTFTSVPDQGTAVTLLLPLAHSTPSERMDAMPGSTASSS